MILLQCGKVWKTLQITRHYPPAFWRINNWQTILMSFTVDLEKHPKPALNTSPHNHWHLQQPPPPPPPPALKISEEDVRQAFRESKRRKTPGPDCVSPTCLKTGADQLAPIFKKIFNRLLELCEVPPCFKCSTIIPSQRIPKVLDWMTTDLWL